VPVRFSTPEWQWENSTRDQADDANGLARYLHVDTGPHRRDFVTDEAQAFAGEAPGRAPLQW
jgi:hypothetical protein